MRKLKSISPSALFCYESNRDLFWTKYCSEKRTQKPPQEVYMAAGSAFDAFVKSRIHTDVFGPAINKGSKYEFQTLFEAQVEEHCRDVCMKLGTFLWSEYVGSGAYSNLLGDILASPYAPQMEFSVDTVVNGIPINGKPDLRYITKMFVHVIADFKVNGSCSIHGVSPVQGYQKVVSTKDAKPVAHKKYHPEMFKDIEVNQNCLSDFSPDWATQLTMYAWSLGEEPGDENYVVRMEQLACRPGGIRSQGVQQVKIATHCSKISARFQMEVMRRLMACWQSLETGHIFTDLTLEQSIEHGELLDKQAAIPIGLHPGLTSALTEKGLRYK